MYPATGQGTSTIHYTATYVYVRSSISYGDPQKVNVKSLSMLSPKRLGCLTCNLE